MIQPSRVLLAPFVMLIAYIGYMLYDGYAHYLMYLVIAGVPAITIYFLRAEIDWWWWTKFPPKLANPFVNFLREHIPFYQNISAADKQKFQTRIALFLRGNEFMPMAELAQGLEEGEKAFTGMKTDDRPEGALPSDLMLLIAATCVQMTFGLKKFLLDKFDHIIVYPRPFPSPTYPEHFHLCETFKEDRVLMITSEALYHYYNSKQKAYSVGFHLYGEAFVENYPKIQWPTLEKDIWDKLQLISGYSSDRIHTYINIPLISARPVSISLFFTHSEKFKEILPNLYVAYTKIFNQDPSSVHKPVLENREL